MNAQDALSTLKENEAALHARRGIVHAALFGSIARGEQHAGSDLDILVEFDPGARLTVFDHVGIKQYIVGLFDGPVDVIDREALRPHPARPAAGDLIYAF